MHSNWLMLGRGFYDDDRIGHGGFEAPNGRRWNEPSQTTATYDYHDGEPDGEILGWFVFDFDKETTRFVSVLVLNIHTDTDDQDWQDFISQLK